MYDYEKARRLREEKFSALVGKTITSVAVNEDQSVLVFETDSGVIAYETEGDRCSETWWSDISGFAALNFGTVIAVEEVDLPEPEDGRTRQEYDQAYGLKIMTDKGIADIAYRNSSNGYYGGGAIRVDGAPQGTFTPVTDDWQA